VQPAYYELSTKITAELNQAINVGHSAWCRGQGVTHISAGRLLPGVLREEIPCALGEHGHNRIGITAAEDVL